VLVLRDPRHPRQAALAHGRRRRHGGDALAERGVVELNLVSQDTIAYGRDLDEKPTLAAAPRALGEVRASWIRVHYLYPETLTESSSSSSPSTRRCCPTSTCRCSTRATHAQAHAPRPRRRAAAAWSDTLRAEHPRHGVRTTFIVGHPGETDADFEELVEVRAVGRVRSRRRLPYSHEEDTHAGTMTDLVPARRSRGAPRKLMGLQRPISRKKLEGARRHELEVLVDGESDESEFLLEGRWWGQAPEVDGKIYLANGSVTAAADYDLVADLLAEDGTHDSPVPAPKKKRVALRTIA
jgi:ribosomal protein S12 methylthiotransferase